MKVKLPKSKFKTPAIKVNRPPFGNWRKPTTWRRFFGQLGWGAWIANEVVQFTLRGDNHDGQRTAALIIVGLAFIPMFVRLHFEGRRLKREREDHRIEMLVHKTIIDIFVPGGYERAKTLVEVREMFKEKS